VESQQTYAVYMARLLCYSLRVLQSCEDSERLEGTVDHQPSEGRDSESDVEDDSEHDEDSEGDSESGSYSDTYPVIIDVFKDAHRLYPWQGRQKDLLRRVREGIKNGWDKKSQLKALLDFYESLIF
jgi:hypothetical protein